ncbi:hypothetical protein L2E82_02160 [Cichorium intybus]|uniref:Uncharacterized protein n=1 Tax=Cichorium intybus TaxID=13427 RepID=A0ACB9H0X4_CICIN|nr:hypothetical protein L2E82_02160 [Cichorium intybus]
MSCAWISLNVESSRLVLMRDSGVDDSSGDNEGDMMEGFKHGSLQPSSPSKPPQQQKSTRCVTPFTNLPQSSLCE